MDMMQPDGLQRMQETIKYEWEVAIENWMKEKKVVLYEESKKLLMRAIYQWAGVPLVEDEVEEWANNMAAMFETPMTIGLKQYKGRKARRKSEKWIGEMVEDIREKKLSPSEDSVLYQFSWHKDLDGNLLDPQIVAVEVLNILRPTVAVSIYINFIAVSLYQHPKEKKKLASGDDKELEMFVQEVRRFYPFFPFNGARVKEDFIWKGYKFKKGTLTLLDFYGTNHDDSLWENSKLFKPDRFNKWKNNDFTLIPQGGGDHYTGHRCPGEWMTLDIMKISLDYLANKISYEVPDQDLSYSLVNIPSIPKSKFIMENVQGN